MDFTGKVVLITGASSGLGAKCAIHFAKYSATLSLVGRNVDRLQSVAKQCEEVKDVAPLVIKADLTIDAEVKHIIDESLKAYGRIDVLVNNAAIGFAAGITDGMEYYDKVMATNLRSVYLLTSLAIPSLIMSTGTIVNISSIGSTTPVPEFLSYCLSKAAIDMLTKCIAKEYAIDGIRVNSVNPGPMKTDFLETSGMPANEIAAYFKDSLNRSPLGRLATINDVANLVTFLASDNARSITGCHYFVDNGFLLGK